MIDFLWLVLIQLLKPNARNPDVCWRNFQVSSTTVLATGLDRREVDFELICKLWKVLELLNNDDSATSKYLTLLLSIEGLRQR